MLLTMTGHEVQTCHDGLSALRAAEEFGPEVVLLDIGLPGMDGYEVARRLREQPLSPQPLLVALSGYGQAEDLRRSREAGFDQHLVKPADPEVLRALFASAPAAPRQDCPV
jgi:CheY-like chemotaxis protein